MDWALYAELAGLGLAAVDPIGIALMPILLAQPRGLTRAWTFVLGSLAALMVLGMVFTGAVGTYVLDWNRQRPWLESGIEVFGAVVLVLLGAFMLWRSRSGESTHAPDNIVAKLTLPLPLLFAFGAILVTIQSLVDVVFVIAMVDAGAEDLGPVQNLVAVSVYAVCALLIQMAVVVAFLMLPTHRRESAMAAFSEWLARNGERVSGWVSLGLGLVLFLTSLPDLLDALE
jgi:predicted membrane channel-forming protein YqfA (hemolysin III family)